MVCQWLVWLRYTIKQSQTTISLNNNSASVIILVEYAIELEAKSSTNLCHSKENKSGQHAVNLNANVNVKDNKLPRVL